VNANRRVRGRADPDLDMPGYIGGAQQLVVDLVSDPGLGSLS